MELVTFERTTLIERTHECFPGHISPPWDPSQPPTVNVVLFGETGAGKSSVINLIARKEIEKVSLDVDSCTMQSIRYDIPFDGMFFAIFDTIGLEEPQIGVNGYLGAIEKAYELIVKLGAAGGIHLLLFCMRGGRITATTLSNYRLFCECLCYTKVPTALVVTGLEREVEMEDWWMRHKTHIEHYGIKSDGHACITTVQDEAPGEDLKYMESQKRIRELLKTCALKNEAFLPELHSWFAKLGEGMRSFIEKNRNPKRRDVMRVLTNRCKLDPETARKIAEMMKKGDTGMKDGNQDEQVGEGGSNPVIGKDEYGFVKNNAANSDALPHQHGNVNAEPRNNALEGKDKSEVANESVARDNSTLAIRQRPYGGRPKVNVARDNQHDGVKAEPRHDALEGMDGGRPRMNVARENALTIQHGCVEAEPRNDSLEGLDGGRPKMGGSDGDQSLNVDTVEQAKSKRDDTNLRKPQASRSLGVTRPSINLLATRSVEPKNDHGAGNVRANVPHRVELTSALPRTYIASRGPIALNAASHRQRRTFWRHWWFCHQAYCLERDCKGLVGG